jgi:hypothetical protein
MELDPDIFGFDDNIIEPVMYGDEFIYYENSDCT